MWQLKRVHLQRVGHGDARFDPLSFDVSDEDGVPVDTVVWLENGGGKTSLLSLMFAVLAPASNEFLGRKHGRALGDYVGSGDVGHVVLEWTQPSGRLPGVGVDDRLITGLILEWTDLRQRRDSPQALNRWTYGFRSDGPFGALSLPFADGGWQAQALIGVQRGTGTPARPHAAGATASAVIEPGRLAPLAGHPRARPGGVPLSAEDERR